MHKPLNANLLTFRELHNGVMIELRVCRLNLDLGSLLLNRYQCFALSPNMALERTCVRLVFSLWCSAAAQLCR